MFLRTKMCLKAEKLRVKTPKSIMLSSVTDKIFPPSCQEFLTNKLMEKGYISPYWLTLPQARRTCNTTINHGELPTTVYLSVEAVMPFKCLPSSMGQSILRENPPYFSMGVGILSVRGKWTAVHAARLYQKLNPEGEERVLFVDVKYASSLKVNLNPSKVIDIREQSSVELYNADQLADPYKGIPQKGVAFNAVTGKRLGQPAHDLLLTIGLMRGYTSPMWIAVSQIKHLHLTIRKNALKEGVPTSTMMGMIVSVTSLPEESMTSLLDELQNRADGFGADVFFLYTINGWEAMRSKGLISAMSVISDERYPFHFVNLMELPMRHPEMKTIAEECIGTNKPLGHPPEFLKKSKSSSKNRKKASKVSAPPQEEDGIPAKKNNQSTPISRPLHFFAEDVTQRVYFNASCMTTPHFVVPPIRPIAILDGRLIGRRDETLLHNFALTNKLSSPLWYNERSLRLAGLSIPPENKSLSVQIGPIDNSVGGTMEQFYNIDDFENKKDILTLFPPPTRQGHLILDTKWLSVLGKSKQSYLKSLKRKESLWISTVECLMSGFRPKQNVKPLTFPKKEISKEIDPRKLLWNSQHTSDPIRAIAMGRFYSRPQGYLSF